MNRSLLAPLALLVASPGVLALPWSMDMVDQPSIKAQEAPVERPADVIATESDAGAPTPRSLAEVVTFRLEAGRTLGNPVEANEKSVARGKLVYQTHCLVCHGAGGKGDGPVGKKFVPPPMDLTTPYVTQQADGQIFYTITHGGVVMPFYRDAIDTTDRWHLINYLRREIKAQ